MKRRLSGFARGANRVKAKRSDEGCVVAPRRAASDRRSRSKSQPSCFLPNRPLAIRNSARTSKLNQEKQHAFRLEVRMRRLKINSRKCGYSQISPSLHPSQQDGPVRSNRGKRAVAGHIVAPSKIQTHPSTLSCARFPPTPLQNQAHIPFDSRWRTPGSAFKTHKYDCEIVIPV